VEMRAQQENFTELAERAARRGQKWIKHIVRKWESEISWGCFWLIGFCVYIYIVTYIHTHTHVYIYIQYIYRVYISPWRNVELIVKYIKDEFTNQ
jgi:nitrogenase molybdenum-iron protein alpha/beta subunit